MEFNIGDKVEYRPFEECRDTDKVSGIITSIEVDGSYEFLPDWKIRKGLKGTCKIDKYHIFKI